MAAAQLFRQVPIQIPEKLLPLIKPKQFKIIHGGRGSAKSHSVAQLLLLKGSLSKHRILCVREVQKSLKESSMQVLSHYIEKWGMEDEWKVLDKEIRNVRNGTVIHFIGLKDHTADSIKSLERYTLVWAEEAHSITAESWNKLIPTIIRTKGAEIWATFNPDDEEDYVYVRFVKNHDPDAMVIEMNWRDNPWFEPAMNVERLKLKAVNDDLYQHVWEGKCRTVTGKLFKRGWAKWYVPSEKPTNLRPYAASDYAATEDGGDFTEHGQFGLDSAGCLYITDWWSGQKDPEIWIKAMVAQSIRHKPLIWFEEKGPLLRATTSAIDKRFREMGRMQYRRALQSAGNKADRALGFAARMAAGMVYFPLDAQGNPLPWALRLLNQLCAFTGEPGKVDDAVDVCSLVARGLDSMSNASASADDDDEGPVMVGDRRFREQIYADDKSDQVAVSKRYR